MRGLLNTSDVRTLLEFFESEVLSGHAEEAFGSEVVLPPQHRIASHIQSAVQEVVSAQGRTAAYHELAVIRRYYPSTSPLDRHCDNRESPAGACFVDDFQHRCLKQYQRCLVQLMRNNVCSKIKDYSKHTSGRYYNYTRFQDGLMALFRTLPEQTHCREMPYACLGLHCDDAFLDPSGCHSCRVRAHHVPKRHCMFRSMSLSVPLSRGSHGGDLIFYDWPTGMDENSSYSLLPPGDGLLFDSGTPHGVTPLESGTRTVLLYWFHSEPWGAQKDSLAQRAYETHVKSLTNVLYNAEVERGPVRARWNWRLKKRLYRAIELYHNFTWAGAAGHLGAM